MYRVDMTRNWKLPQCYCTYLQRKTDMQLQSCYYLVQNRTCPRRIYCTEWIQVMHYTTLADTGSTLKYLLAQLMC